MYASTHSLSVLDWDDSEEHVSEASEGVSLKGLGENVSYHDVGRAVN